MSEIQNKRITGTTYEDVAAAFLEKQGVRILERNYRCRRGEIDLIGMEQCTIIFFEVKYRANSSAGSAASAVNHRKQVRISRVAEFYLYSRLHRMDVPCRFDVIAFDGEECTWIQDAFPFSRY